ncbi:MAG: D-aminoacyl-tRNA deacylase [Acidiferrobacterales bacterium]
MIGLLQRVTSAQVTVGEEAIGEIGSGLLALIGIERKDNENHADRLLERLLSYRVFPDETGRMNRSLQDVTGGLLLVPNFTLVADTKKGTRASFTPAAAPADSKRLFDHLVDCARARYAVVQSGVFGAHMKVTLTNDGPVTFWLRV